MIMVNDHEMTNLMAKTQSSIAKKYLICKLSKSIVHSHE
jgi:hypothetical protein